MKTILSHAVAVLTCTFICAITLAAQANTDAPGPISSCSRGLSGGGPDCALDRRLLIDLRLHGKGATPDIATVVDIGASAGGVFALTPAYSTTADSVAFAIVDVTRDTVGTYRIDARMTGLFVTSANDCHNVSTGRLPDLAFGARLGLATAQFVRCAQNNRPNYRKE
jgi:hypothetical protein